MKKKYGITWWGRQWLNALNNIDYSNRLPRGRTYANKGLVRSISITDNEISALVDGSRPRPYKVSIEIPPFDKLEKNKVIKVITANVLFLSKLLNRELPPALNKACELEGVNIFPHAWSDLEGSCSCPDWAVPCKHMAAVLYLIANEIDKNPFLVFELHELDLLEELEGIGYTTEEEKEIGIPRFPNLMNHEKPDYPAFEWSDEVFDTLDFSDLPELRENLLKLLTDQPVFYPSGDFKKLLNRAYIESSKLVSRDQTDTVIDQRLVLEKIAHASIFLDEENRFKEASFYSGADERLFHFTTLDKLIEWLVKIPMSFIPQLSIRMRGLILTFRLAQKLVEKSACIPQLLVLEDQHYFVRWIPAYLNEEIWELTETVEILTPFGLLTYRIENKEYYPIESDDFPALISMFLSYYFEQVDHRSFDFYNQPVERLFFNASAESFTDFEDRSYPSAIQLWLSRLFLTEKQYIPVLKILEEGDRFQLEVEIEDKSQVLSPYISLSELMNKEDYDTIRISVLRDLAMLSDHFPEISTLIATGGKEKLFFNSSSFVKILFEVLPTIRLFGIKVLLPKALHKLLNPQLSMRMETGDDGTVSTSSVISLEQMLRFKWQIAIGDQLMEPEEFFEKTKALQGIVKINDQFVHLEEAALKKLLLQIETPTELAPHVLLQTALTEDYEGAKVTIDNQVKKLINQLFSTKKVATPDGLQATLRPYQLRGYEWLYQNAKIGFGSLIADDMGLGKTLQVITTLLKLKEEGSMVTDKALVILPTTLLSNWEKEIKKFAPTLQSFIYHGAGRDIKNAEEADVVLTTYGIARIEATKLNKHNWLCVVLDESQNIKNPSSAQTKAIKKIKAPVRIAMSGTPVENRLSEYWSVFDFTNKGYLGNLKHFKTTYAKPIEVERNQSQIERFRKITAPFIMRRLKTDKSIIKDLPDITEKNQYCHLTKEQAALYQSVLDNTLETVEASTGISRQGLILKLITALKQICNHPRQFLKKGPSDPELSGKTLQLLQLLPSVLENNEKALIFTQYREMGELLRKIINEQLGFEPPFLHGGCSRKQRDEMVDDFQTNRATHFLILSIKAGGTGLNLTAANHVFHYDLWWNPAVEKQATDRAYRIGQKRNVLVHRFITEATFEEKIDQLLKKKKNLADLTVASGEKWIGDLSNNELHDLVALS